MDCGQCRCSLRYYYYILSNTLSLLLLWLVGYFRDECFVLIPGGLWTVVVDDGYLSDHLHNKLATKDRKC